MAKKSKDLDYSAYAPSPIGHNQPEEVAHLTHLAEAQYKAQVKVENLEEQLKTAKEEFREIAERQLPEKMDTLGVSSFKTSAGISISVKEKIQAAISVENRPKAYDWLEKNGFGGVIKTNVVVPFKRDELLKARKLAEKLGTEFGLANVDRKVEAQTLLALVREQLAQGKDIPIDLFGVFRMRIAKVEK